MYHYIVKVKVPAGGEAIISKETIIDRLEYFNDNRNYLLYDSGDETEKRFIMITQKKLNKDMTTDLRDIF